MTSLGLFLISRIFQNQLVQIHIQRPAEGLSQLFLDANATCALGDDEDENKIQLFVPIANRTNSNTQLVRGN